MPGRRKKDSSSSASEYESTSSSSAPLKKRSPTKKRGKESSTASVSSREEKKTKVKNVRDRNSRATLTKTNKQKEREAKEVEGRRARQEAEARRAEEQRKEEQRRQREARRAQQVQEQTEKQNAAEEAHRRFMEEELKAKLEAEDMEMEMKPRLASAVATKFRDSEAKKSRAKAQADEAMLAERKKYASVYTAHAGQTVVRGVVPRDKWGNAEEGQYDLGRDGAFAGKVVLIINFVCFVNYDDVKAALERKGFTVVEWSFRDARGDPIAPPLDELRAKLNEVNTCQLWVVSCEGVRLSDAHVDAIKDFVANGGGLYLWGDDDPLFGDANELGERLIGSTLSGDVPGDQVLREKSRGSKGGFVKHLITTGVEHMYEGFTVSTVDCNDRVQPLVYGSDGSVVCGVCESGRERILIDGGFTRLFHKWDTAGTARYVRNAACWLAENRLG